MVLEALKAGGRGQLSGKAGDPRDQSDCRGAARQRRAESSLPI